MDYQEKDSGTVQVMEQLEHTALLGLYRGEPSPCLGHGGDTDTSPQGRAGAAARDEKWQLLHFIRTVPLGAVRMLGNAVFGKKTLF